MQLTIENAKKISDDVFLAFLTPEEIGYFGGRPVKGGRKSVVIVENARFIEGILKVQPDSAFIANVGSSNEVIFIDRQELPLPVQVNFENESYLDGALVRQKITDEPDSKSTRYYWVTVGKGLQENFELAMSENVWGVEGKYSDRINSVKEGDFILFYGKDIGFALCQVEKGLFEDRSRIWPDGIYPYRIRISQPVQRSLNASLSDVSSCLRGPENRTYDSVNAAGRAIGGAAGVFRPLKPNEQRRIFEQLGWSSLVDQEGK